jgi:hypothetical protein
MEMYLSVLINVSHFALQHYFISNIVRCLWHTCINTRVYVCVCVCVCVVCVCVCVCVCVGTEEVTENLILEQVIGFNISNKIVQYKCNMFHHTD